MCFVATTRYRSTACTFLYERQISVSALGTQLTTALGPHSVHRDSNAGCLLAGVASVTQKAAYWLPDTPVVTAEIVQGLSVDHIVTAA